MDPLKDLMDIQKQFLENIVPKQYLAQFDKLMGSYKDIDPGIFLKHFKDAMENLTGNSGLNLGDFYKNLQQNSDKFMNLFKTTFENPLNFFKGFLDNLGFSSMTKSAAKPSQK